MTTETQAAPTNGPEATQTTELPGGQPQVQGQGDPLSLGDPAPTTPEAKPAATPEAKTEPTKVQYAPSGDPGLDLALSYIGDRGFGADHPAVQAATNGDFSLLRAELAKLGDKASDAEKFLALAEAHYAREEAGHKERRTKDLAAIHDAVGGEEAWNEVRAWAGANAEPHEKEAVNAALKAGGIQAKSMAMYLAHLHSKADNVDRNPAEVTQPSASGKPSAGGEVTAKQFALESEALRQRLGYEFESSSEFRILAARRDASRKRGF